MAARGHRTIAALMEDAAGANILVVAAHTVAEFYRGGRASAEEAPLMRAWRVQFLDVTVSEGKLAGELLAETGGSNSMDALVVAAASLHRVHEIFTTDRRDLARLRDALPASSWHRFGVVDIR